jgi:prevent-host-death family protein
MRTVSAIEVRKHFGKLIDEAAAGERLIIERAGQPIAAIVPLSDVEQYDPARRRQERLEALEEMIRYAKQHPAPPGFDAARIIREQRDERTEHIARVVREYRGKQDSDAKE